MTAVPFKPGLLKRLFPALLLVPLNPSSGQDWPTYNQSVEGWRHNAAERVLTTRNVSRLSLKWRYPGKDSKKRIGMICATPSVVGGYVYFGTATFPAFYKLRPNGELAWKFQLGSEDEKIRFQEMESQGLIPRGGVYSSALVTEDAVFFGSVRGAAYCLDRKTGKER